MQKQQIVLGYLLKQADLTQEIPSKFGGYPVWLYQHKIQSFQCSFCKQSLTFLFQLYAPQNQDHTFHRALYVFFCESAKCQNNKKAFKVFRMQLRESDNLVPVTNKQDKHKTLSEQYLIETDIITNDELKKIQQKVLKDFKQSMEDNDDDQQQEQIEDIKNYKHELVNEDEDLEELEEEKKNNSDPIFQIYKGTLSKLNYPVVFYAWQPLEFKNQHINVSQKRCSTCKGIMRFEFQINSCLLESFQKLVNFDWGTIRIYTCKQSCKAEFGTVFRQDVQLQIEQDMALNKQQFEQKLKQIQKQRMKKQALKQKKKLKKKQKKQKYEQQKQDKEQAIEEQGEGDWD